MVCEEAALAPAPLQRLFPLPWAPFLACFTHHIVLWSPSEPERQQLHSGVRGCQASLPFCPGGCPAVQLSFCACVSLDLKAIAGAVPTHQEPWQGRSGGGMAWGLPCE